MGMEERNTGANPPPGDSRESTFLRVLSSHVKQHLCHVGRVPPPQAEVCPVVIVALRQGHLEMLEAVAGHRQCT